MTYYTEPFSIYPHEIRRSTYGNEEVRNPSLILEPSLAVLIAAASNVASGTMGNHADEENGVEPGERAPVLLVSLSSFIT